MKANPQFANLPKSFWATVRSLSQQIGYTRRGEGQVKVPSVGEMRQAFVKLSLDPTHVGDDSSPTQLAVKLHDYFKYRADVLNTYVEPRLMDDKRAALEFELLKAELSPTCPLPANKQSGDKKKCRTLLA